MPLDLVTIPCLSDNYAFLIHDAASGDTAVIDVPEAAPILAALHQRGWTLSQILLTRRWAMKRERSSTSPVIPLDTSPFTFRPLPLCSRPTA